MARNTRATVRQCEALMRYAATLRRLDVERCNMPWTDRHERKRKNIERRVLVLCKELEMEPYFSYEPMTAAFYLRLPNGFASNFERTGVNVP